MGHRAGAAASPSAIALLALTGYVYAILAFYGVGHFNPMALNTTLAFLTLCAGALLARPDARPVAWLVSPWPMGRVVDDMAVVHDLIAAALQSAGYRTITAADGREAMKAVRAQRPDLILLDVLMPEMGGLEFLRYLRAEPAPRPRRSSC